MFRAAVGRVDPYDLIVSRLRVQNDVLHVDCGGGVGRALGCESALGGGDFSLDLAGFRSIVIVGAGKATAKMAAGIESVLRDRIEAGVIAVKPGHVEQLSRIRMVEAGHPVPNEGSVRAGTEIADLCRKADADTLVLALVSGGGSALMESPLSFDHDGEKHRVTLTDLQQTTRALLGCGATIQEINTIRKHLSSIKGGRLAELCFPATLVTLILSDVVGDGLDSIASGITTSDATTYGEAFRIIERYGIRKDLPETVLLALKLGASGKLPETPKSGSKLFERVHNILLGTNYDALVAGAARAAELGYSPLVLSSRVTGEARQVALVFAAIARDLAAGRGPVPAPACVIAGGETTVTIRGDGLGGRNQELALSVLRDFTEDDAGIENVGFASVATDGNDGPTDAAGGFADLEAVREVRRAGTDPEEALRRNDSYHLLEAAGALIRTGPTNTNVCDMQIILVR